MLVLFSICGWPLLSALHILSSLFLSLSGFSLFYFIFLFSKGARSQNESTCHRWSSSYKVSTTAMITDTGIVWNVYKCRNVQQTNQVHPHLSHCWNCTPLTDPLLFSRGLLWLLLLLLSLSSNPKLKPIIHKVTSDGAYMTSLPSLTTNHCHSTRRNSRVSLFLKLGERSTSSRLLAIIYVI